MEQQHHLAAAQIGDGAIDLPQAGADSARRIVGSEYRADDAARRQHPPQSVAERIEQQREAEPRKHLALPRPAPAAPARQRGTPTCTTQMALRRQLGGSGARSAGTAPHPGGDEEIAHRAARQHEGAGLSRREHQQRQRQHQQRIGFHVEARAEPGRRAAPPREPAIEPVGCERKRRRCLRRSSATPASSAIRPAAATSPAPSSSKPPRRGWR